MVCCGGRKEGGWEFFVLANAVGRGTRGVSGHDSDTRSRRKGRTDDAQVGLSRSKVAVSKFRPVAMHLEKLGGLFLCLAVCGRSEFLFWV